MNTKDNITISKKRFIGILSGIGVLFILLLSFMLHSMLSSSANYYGEGPTESIAPSGQQTETTRSGGAGGTTQPTSSTAAASQAGQAPAAANQSQQAATNPPKAAATNPSKVAATTALPATTAPPATTAAPPATKSTPTVIGIERAKSIALANAGLRASDVTISKIKHEWDDGIQVYDVEFYYMNMEYEYEIDALTGRIISKEIDD